MKPECRRCFEEPCVCSGDIREALPRTVVCAAIRIGGVILTGARHWDSIMRAQADRIFSSREELVAARKMKREDQGFIDQYGVFMDRKEAREVAMASGQRLRNTNPEEKMLFSEDLY